jgi:glycosyltransferase involved in cell wall biosynthesis
MELSLGEVPEAVPASSGQCLTIGLEFRNVALGHSGGIAPHLKGVLEALFALHPEHTFHVYTTVFNRSLLENRPGSVRLTTLPLRSYKEELDQALVTDMIDVLFQGYPLDDVLSFPVAKRVVFIPDMQHEFFPEFFTTEVLRNRRLAFGRVLSGAGAVGTNSECARQHLRDYPWTSCRDIFLMNPALRAVAEVQPEDLLAEERALIPTTAFFLFPANLLPHKNHRRLLQAFALFLRQTGRDMTLVLSGNPDGWPDLQADFPSLPVRHLGFVRPQLLQVLLARARALVFFSLFEGFGMPLLEAFDAGTPVLCSNTTSLPEVGQDAVLPCDPTDVPAMSRLMERIAAEDGLARALAARGKARLRAYSWEQSARSLFAALERVARRKGPESLSPWEVSSHAYRPLVSLVTPAAHQGESLQRTLASIASQTYPHLEHVLLDTSAAAGQGRAEALNQAFAQAQGEIRAILYPGEVLASTAVATVVEYFRRHPACDLVHGPGGGLNDLVPTAVFWRRRIADVVGPFDKGWEQAVEQDYWLRIDKAGGRIEQAADLPAVERSGAEPGDPEGQSRWFQEAIQVYARHRGKVPFPLFRRAWQHECKERPDGWARCVGWLPGLSLGMALVHFAWWNRRHYSWKRIALGVGRRIVRVTGSLGKKLR